MKVIVSLAVEGPYQAGLCSWETPEREKTLDSANR